jgi:hypothetical protein
MCPNPIDGWFLEEEGAWYQEMVASRSEGLVVEIGSWKGRSTSFLAPVLAGRPARLVCVDHYSGSSDQWDLEYRRALEEEALRGHPVKSQFEKNMESLGIKYRLLNCSSNLAVTQIPDCSADVIFIDASHDRQSVLDDLRRWLPKVRHSGVLVGHDYGIEHPSVMSAVHDFSLEVGRPMLRGPGTIYFFEKDPAKYVFNYEVKK